MDRTGTAESFPVRSLLAGDDRRLESSDSEATRILFCPQNSFFHATPILQRKHQSNSKARSNRFGRKRAKQDLRRNVNAFAQHLFGIWSDGFDYSGKHTSWFEKQYYRVSKRNRNKRCFDFCGVDEGAEIDYFIRNALGGSGGFSYSNTHEDGEARSWKYSNNSTRSWGSRHRLDEEEEEEEEEYSSTEFSDFDANQESHRQTLGLSSSGPLNLEDVKIALLHLRQMDIIITPCSPDLVHANIFLRYRASALKWHPDRHQGSAKNAAEEKFKLCTLAYQSLCKKLAMN